MPGNELNKIDKIGLSQFLKFENADKLIHACMFFGLAFIFQFLKRRSLYSYFFVPFSISFMIEIFQKLMPFGRTFDWLDLLANSLGIITAIIVVQCIKKAKT